MKIRQDTLSTEHPIYLFHCVGCKMLHWFKTEGEGPKWMWNNDPNCPTVKPSLVIPATKCHLFITDGKLVYLSDCEHELAGQTVDMIDLAEDDC